MRGYWNVVVVTAVTLLQVHFSLCLAIRNTDDVIQSSGRPNAPGETFHFTRVSKEDLGDVYRVKVEYEADSKPSTVLLMTDDEKLTSVQNKGKLGVVEVEVPKSASEYGSAALMVAYPNNYFVAMLRLVDTPDSMEVPRMVGRVAQGYDVTYAPGSDVLLDVSLKMDGDLDAIGDFYFHYEVLVKSDSEENRVDRYNSPSGQWGDAPVWLDLVSDNEVKGDRQATFLLNSTLADPRGVLRLSGQVRMNCSDACLLQLVMMSGDVRFYSQEHSGPFPPGFLGFVKNEYSSDSSQTVCDARNTRDCRILCEAYSSDSVTVEISRVLPSGKFIPTDGMMASLGSWAVANLVIPDVTSASAGVYRCTARSEAIGRQVSQDTEIDVILSARIDRELSQLTRFDNGSAAATCVAEGNPTPNVTFDTSYYAFYDASPGDYDVTTTKLDENTMKTDIFVTNPDLVESLYMLECRATNVQEPDSYRFSDHLSLYLDESLNVGNFSYYG